MPLNETGSISRPETSTCPEIGGRSDKRDDATLVTRPQPDSSTQEVVAGLVERVTFMTRTVCVLRTKARGHRAPVLPQEPSPTLLMGSTFLVPEWELS